MDVRAQNIKEEDKKTSCAADDELCLELCEGCTPCMFSNDGLRHCKCSLRRLLSAFKVEWVHLLFIIHRVMQKMH